MIQRSFYIGSEWIYYKWYCGKRVADELLVEVIKPLTEDLMAQQLIDQWFFIRYHDPDFHLRIRFHVDDITKTGTVIHAVYERIQAYVAEAVIWNVQTDTYQREIERYGESMILFSEKLFGIDSQTCVQTLSLVEDDELLFLFTAKRIDQLLTLCNLTIEEKIAFVQNHEEAFKEEFTPDKAMNQAIKEKYRSISKQLVHFLENDLTGEYKPLEEVLHQEKAAYIEEIKTISYLNKDKVLQKNAAAYIHMMVNRTFRDQQRKYEWLLYNFLVRAYKTLQAKRAVCG